MRITSSMWELYHPLCLIMLNYKPWEANQKVFKKRHHVFIFHVTKKKSYISWFRAGVSEHLFSQSLCFLFLSDKLLAISLKRGHMQHRLHFNDTPTHTVSQETDDDDDEDEESCYLKERFLSFLGWLQGFDWFQRLTRRRQQRLEWFESWTQTALWTLLHDV